MYQKTTFRDFPEFYNNPVIQRIAENKRWTVSTTKDVVVNGKRKSSKMPIDMYELINNEHVWGCAWDRGHHPLVDLNTLCDVIPNATNNAYYLNADEDGFVILDVEGRCSDYLKEEFLKLPYLYGELSMSGHGLHLIFPFPKHILEKYPNAINKASLQSENKDYEILLADHFVTFMRCTLPPSSNERTEKDFENLFESLCKIQNASISAESVKITDIDTSNIDLFDDIVAELEQKTYNKTLEDFSYKNKSGYDNSAYEHYFTRFYYKALKRLLKQKPYSDMSYTDEEKAIIIYTIATKHIPHRDKHDELRSGMPFLLFIVTRMIAKTDIQDMEWAKNKKQS